jgi:hypothetical protein
MAVTYKPIDRQDISSVRTRLHEAIPITGSIVSGTYGDTNIKNYAHAMFQSVYDYPYLSSSANHIFDLSYGLTNQVSGYSSVTVQQQKKTNIYNQMSQLLVGYDTTGSIRQFDRDGIFDGDTAATASIQRAIFIPFSRLLVKDEIKKESFSMTFGISSSYNSVFTQQIVITDSASLTNYRTNSPAGEYALLYASNSVGQAMLPALQAGQTNARPVGLIYYQAGIVVLNTLAFATTSSDGIIAGGHIQPEWLSSSVGAISLSNTLTGSTISSISDGFRRRIGNISFNNTTELNSTIYFCRVGNSDFNYSANPTYLTGSQIVVKNTPTDDPVAYFTTVGLYSADNELLAVAKLSEPLRKDPTISHTIRVRLDY